MLYSCDQACAGSRPLSDWVGLGQALKDFPAPLCVKGFQQNFSSYREAHCAEREASVDEKKQCLGWRRAAHFQKTLAGARQPAASGLQRCSGHHRNKHHRSRSQRSCSGDWRHCVLWWQCLMTSLSQVRIWRGRVVLGTAWGRTIFASSCGGSV